MHQLLAGIAVNQRRIATSLTVRYAFLSFHEAQELCQDVLEQLLGDPRIEARGERAMRSLYAERLEHRVIDYQRRELDGRSKDGPRVRESLVDDQGQLRSDLPSAPAPWQPTAASGSPEDELDRRRVRNAIVLGLAELDPEERAVLALRYVDALSAAAVQKRLGLGKKRYEYIHTRGYDKLASHLRLTQAGRECEKYARLVRLEAAGIATAHELARLALHSRDCAGCAHARREHAAIGKGIAAVFPPIAVLEPLAAQHHSPITATLDTLRGWWEWVRDHLLSLILRSPAADAQQAGLAAQLRPGAIVAALMVCGATAGGACTLAGIPLLPNVTGSHHRRPTRPAPPTRRTAPTGSEVKPQSAALLRSTASPALSVANGAGSAARQTYHPRAADAVAHAARRTRTAQTRLGIQSAAALTPHRAIPNSTPRATPTSPGSSSRRGGGGSSAPPGVRAGGISDNGQQ